MKDLDKIDVREGLIKLLKSKKIPHAFLFAGPKGIGKTSAARILAKAVNCEKKKNYEPCNRCEICRSITAGTALDLIEIDGASNRGIDDIRNLREKIKLSPVKCRYKVYIIDEAHMLTTEAFNALLKTLEEPPKHALFVLCTTAPEKLPQTIISRCVRFNFPRATVEEIISSLKRVVRGEKLKVEKEVLKLIAKRADGSFRDGQKILDQLNTSGKKITLKETKKLLGQIEEWSPKKLLGFLAQKDLKASLQEINRIVLAGADLTIYNQGILDWLRQSLLAQVGLSNIKQAEETKSLGLNQIKLLISLFSRAYGELKFSPIPQLPLELVVVEFCLVSGESKPPRRVTKPISNSDKVILEEAKVSLEEVVVKWPEVLAQVKPLNHSVEALLRASRPIKIDSRKLTLEVFYKFHKERLETDKCRRIVEEAASQVLGRPVQLRCVLGEKRKSEQEKSFAKPANNDIINVAEEIFSGKLIN